MKNIIAKKCEWLDSRQRKRAEEINSLREQADVEHRSRCSRVTLRKNTALLSKTPEITRQQGICFIMGMPTAWLQARFENGDPNDDVCISRMKGKDCKCSWCEFKVTPEVLNES